MGMSVREQGIFVEIESAYGVAATLEAADALLVSDVQFNPAESLRMIERSVINSSLNPRKAVYGGALLGFQFTAELKGSGIAGTAPQALGDLLRACGMDETIVASTSVTYNPSSDLSSHDSVTIGLRQGGNYRIARGCRGSVSLSAPAGEIAKLQFNMIGHISSEAAAAAPTPTFSNVVPPAFLNAAFTIAGTEFPIGELGLDIGNGTSIAPDPNSADGFGDIRVTSRNPNITCDPEEQVISTKDFVGAFRNGTSQAIATGVIGGTAGNRWAVNVPLAYIRNVSYADREELIVAQLELGAEDTDGSDDLSIQLT